MVRDREDKAKVVQEIIKGSPCCNASMVKQQKIYWIWTTWRLILMVVEIIECHIKIGVKQSTTPTATWCYNFLFAVHVRYERWTTIVAFFYLIAYGLTNHWWLTFLRSVVWLINFGFSSTFRWFSNLSQDLTPTHIFLRITVALLQIFEDIDQ